MLKIVAVALICGIIVLYLKSINSDLSTLALVASGIILIALSLSYIVDTFSFFNELIEMTGLSREIYSIIFKITAIGYVVEFGSGTLDDLGLKSLSNKLSFVGKFVIISVSLPIIYALINLLKGFIV